MNRAPLLEEQQPSVPLPKELDRLDRLREYRERSRSSFSNILSYDVLEATLAPDASRQQTTASDLEAAPSGPLPEVSRAISLDVNKRLRRSALLQNRFTNRFQGSPAAEKAELEFAEFVTRYQMPFVRRRLFLFAILVSVGAQIENFVEGSVDGDLVCFLVRLVAPVCVQLLAAAVIWRARPWWRRIVMAALLLSYTFTVVGMAYTRLVLDAKGGEMEPWPEWRLYFHLLCMLIWLALYMQASALLFALDYAHQLLLLPALWATHVVGSLVVLHRWAAAVDGGSPHRLWAYRPVCVYVFAVSLFNVIILLLATRNINRFERKTFINSYVLWNQVSTQSKQMRGTSVELLALFSNPRAASGGLRPLRLGRELKFLLHAVPPVHLAIEPAATLADVQLAVQKKDPRLLLFSGHSFMGSLAFELDNGRLDLPPPAQFIANLHPQFAPRLRCVCLNGCETAELGFQIVSQLPRLKAICWSTATEDAAARAFAQGFYDAVGAFVANGGQAQLELAFLAGLDRFCAAGFVLGDPAEWLHPPEHPHVSNPVLDGCSGCCPPVHGIVSFLVNDLDGGGVHALLPQRLGWIGDHGAPLSWVPLRQDSLRDDLKAVATRCVGCMPTRATISASTTPTLIRALDEGTEPSIGGGARE